MEVHELGKEFMKNYDAFRSVVYKASLQNCEKRQLGSSYVSVRPSANFSEIVPFVR
jgi:hypothetical protein